MKLSGENEALGKKILYQYRFFQQQNPALTDLGWKAGIRGEIPVFKPLSRRSRCPSGLGYGSFVGISDSNPAGGMDVCLLRKLCVVR